MAGAYFLNPAIAEKVGYPGRPAIPVDDGSEPDWLAGRAARLGQVARPDLPPDAGGLSPRRRAARAQPDYPTSYQDPAEGQARPRSAISARAFSVFSSPSIPSLRLTGSTRSNWMSR